MLNIYAVCPPGMEEFAAREISQILLKADSGGTRKPAGIVAGPGGVAFDGELVDLYRVNLWSRLATRFLVRIGSVVATGFPELQRKIERLDWGKFLPPGQPLQMRVTCHKSRLYHSGAVAERIAEGIGQNLGSMPALLKPSENSGAQLIVVRAIRDRFTISLDSSGEPLYRRGYRQATAKAPLRENLAAGLLMAAGWDAKSPLIDPFCGSGTIVIEAAQLAGGLAPGLNRQFSFMRWRNFDEAAWQSLLAQCPAEPNRPLPPIVGADRDAGAIALATGNAQRAGVLSHIQFSCQAISSLVTPSRIGWIVTNPPYGVRVSHDEDLRNLYARTGEVLRQQCPEWNIAMLCSRADLLGHTGLKFPKKLGFDNGGIRTMLAISRPKAAV